MNVQAVIEDANRYIASNNLASAIDTLKTAAREHPSSFEIWSQLSKFLFEDGQYKEAVHANSQSEKFDPLSPKFAQIHSAINTRDFATASQIANDMLSKRAFHPKAISTLAHIATQKNDPQTSVNLLEKGLIEAPASISLRFMLTNSYASAGYFTKALQSAETLIDIDESFDSLWLLIGLQLKYGQYSKLLQRCEQALAYANKSPIKISQLELLKGQALRIIGEKSKAIKVLQSSLKNDPSNVDAWWALADMKDYRFSNTERLSIKSLIDSPQLDKKRKCVAAFAYAKSGEPTEEHTKTMARYKHANELGASEYYSPNMLENEINARMQFYSKPNLQTQADSVNTAHIPIFIVGLPRSGSTLVEQILASHQDIIGTIEQPTLPIIESRAQSLSMNNYNLPLSTGLAKLSPAELSELGNAYLNESALFRDKNARFFIDKQPFNFRLVGFIHKILPHAIIIDVRRNAMDCGFSLYKQYFHSGVDFSYKLGHIGKVYQSYLRLMDYWESVLPKKVHHLQYERLINAPETEIRNLLDFIGITFDQNCMQFYQTKRSVHTASSEQVRQPINKKGIGAWRKVATDLLELQNTLGLNDADLDPVLFGNTE